MSGHSKWHNIQAKKGKADAARGKVFTKLGRCNDYRTDER